MVATNVSVQPTNSNAPARQAWVNFKYRQRPKSDAVDTNPTKGQYISSVLVPRPGVDAVVDSLQHNLLQIDTATTEAGEPFVAVHC